MSMRSYTHLAAAQAPSGQILVAGSSGSSVEVLEAGAARLLMTYAGHQAHVTAVALSPDGRWALSADRAETVHLWDTASGDCLLTYSGHSGKVFALAWSPDGTEVASAGEPGDVHLWNAASGVCRLRYQDHTVLIPAREAVKVEPGPDGRVYWHPPTPAVGRFAWIGQLAWSPDGRFVASLEDCSRVFHVWWAATGQQYRCLQGPVERVNALAWSPDGRRLVTGGNLGYLSVWDLEAGSELGQYDTRHYEQDALAWSPDGGQIAVASTYDDAVQVWDVETGKSVYETSCKGVRRVLWSSPVRLVLVARDGAVHVQSLA